ARSLNGLSIGEYKIMAWPHQGEKRCCPRPSKRHKPPRAYEEKDSSCQKESSELHLNEQAISTTVPREKCVTSNEFINMFEGCEIITSAVGEGLINEDEKNAVLENEKYENYMTNIGTINHDMADNEKFIDLVYEKKAIKQSNQRELKDVVINMENFNIVIKEDDIKEYQGSTDNQVGDTGNLNEKANLEFDTFLEFIQVTEDSEQNDFIAGNDESKPYPPTSTVSKKEKKKKKKIKKEKINSKRIGNWRCNDPSCNFTNSCEDELCVKCKLPCPNAMKHYLEKKDERESYNKYYLAYAKSSVQIYVQDYTQHRDASKMMQILNQRFEKGNIPPEKISKDGLYAVRTEKGWVRGKVFAPCNGIKCFLLHTKKNNLQNIKNEEETCENSTLLKSSCISHENEINIDNFYGVTTSSVLEHQLMVKEENVNATITHKYFDLLLDENEYLCNEKFQENHLSYGKEINSEKCEYILEEGKVADLSQKLVNNPKIFSSGSKISDNFNACIESSQDEKTNDNLNPSQKVHLYEEIEVEKSKDIINENLKFCHVSLIDIGEHCCVSNDNIGLLLHEMAGISEMKTGPVYLDHCQKIDNQTDEMKEEGRKWLKSYLEDKPFQIQWNIKNQAHAQIFINNINLNKELCDRGYANPRGAFKRKCQKCGRCDHMTRECSDVRNTEKYDFRFPEYSDAMSTKTCHYCGELGHIKRNCPFDNNSLENKYFEVTYCSHCGSRKHSTSYCHNIIRNNSENYNNFTSECNTIATYSNNKTEMMDMMVTSYDSLNMSQQHKFRNLSDCIPTVNVNWSPYNMIRSNPSLHSSIFATGQTPYCMAPFTPNYIYTLLEEANQHLSQKEGMVRALQEELTRIRTIGFVGLLDAMEKMKLLMNIDATLAKWNGPDEPMKRALDFLKENMAQYLTPNGQFNLDAVLSKSTSELLKEQDTNSYVCGKTKFNIPKWLTPQEHLAALKVHQEAVEGIRIKKSPLKERSLVKQSLTYDDSIDPYYKWKISPLKGTRLFRQNITYEDAIGHYYKWKVYYDACYYKVKTYYNNMFDEWIKFSAAAKNILNGMPEPNIPIGADMKKFYEQAGKFERLAEESEEHFQNLPEVIISRMKYIILQLEKLVSTLETVKSKKQQPNLTGKETPLDLAFVNESCSEITLAQYMQNIRVPLPNNQVDRIVKEILEDVTFTERPSLRNRIIERDNLFNNDILYYLSNNLHNTFIGGDWNYLLSEMDSSSDNVSISKSLLNLISLNVSGTMIYNDVKLLKD
ncbi:unnamed protein product, partial [Meganyctiphanes norvegica]